MEKEKKRIAVGKVTEELAGMGVGDIVQFPINSYNPSTVRAMPATMVEQRSEGWKWMTKMDFDDLCVYVVRIK